MKELFSSPPVIGFAAHSGTGKTSLLTELVPLLSDHGLRIGVIKHSHHDFEIDRPGKDSYRLRQAGARQMLIASPFRTAWIEEHPRPQEPSLEALLTRLDRGNLDLILVEGFRDTAYPKIEVNRAATGKPWLFHGDDSIIAIATDVRIDTALPQLDLGQPRAVADFILHYMDSINPGVPA
jgi:molybdopterin-guanine dinucleotide biosynthesis protein MobB